MTLLKRQRMAQGLSAEDVATRLKVRVSTVYYWESGANLPRARYIPKLALMLGVDAMTLTRIIAPEVDPRPARVSA